MVPHSLTGLARRHKIFHDGKGKIHRWKELEISVTWEAVSGGQVTLLGFKRDS